MKIDFAEFVNEQLSDCTDREKAEQIQILTARMGNPAEVEAVRQRWKSLESWERFIVRRFYGKFHRKWTIRAESCVQKVVDKVFLDN